MSFKSAQRFQRTENEFSAGKQWVTWHRQPASLQLEWQDAWLKIASLERFRCKPDSLGFGQSGCIWWKKTNFAMNSCIYYLI